MTEPDKRPAKVAMLTVRNLDAGVKAKLRERAARHGRSMEAEVREILAEAVERKDEDMLTVFLEVFHRNPVDLDMARADDQPRAMEFDQ